MLLTKCELDELFLVLQAEAKAECDIPQNADLDRSDLYALSRTSRWRAAYVIASLRTEIWNEAIEAAALTAEAPDRIGREWVPGSLWDAIKKDTASDIRKLKIDPDASLPGSIPC
jgi:hypothetical protein